LVEHHFSRGHPTCALLPLLAYIHRILKFNLRKISNFCWIWNRPGALSTYFRSSGDN